jgi:isopentenyldiphosphate isomerase
MPFEQVDVLDCAGRRTGTTNTRDEAHRAGQWHGAFHCLLFYPRNGAVCALFQKRSNAKQIAPGKFDVTVGGHYMAGEDAEAAGPREIDEELGLSVDFGSLVPVGRRTFVYCFTPRVQEYEFQDVFLLPMDGRPVVLRLQPGEVDAVLELELGQGIALFSGAAASVQAAQIAPEGTVTSVSVSAGDFVPCLDNYYLKILFLARRYASGERSLLVI